MNTKRLHTVMMAVLMGLVMVIPASAQILPDDEGIGESHLPLLILVNQMELSADQMEAIRDLVEGVLEHGEVVQTHRDAFEAEMIAFTGSAEELEDLLDAFRAEMEERTEAARVAAADALDEAKGILTVKQGELLAESLSGLLDNRMPRGRGFDPGPAGRRPFGDDDEAAFDVRERLFNRIRERAADDPEFRERLEERMAPSFPGGMDEGQGPGAGLGRPGFALREGAADRPARPVLRGAMAHRGMAWLEILLEVLELKLEAIG